MGSDIQKFGRTVNGFSRTPYSTDADKTLEGCDLKAGYINGKN